MKSVALLASLLLAGLSFPGDESLTVTQDPPIISVTEGETTHIQCCWNNTITAPTTFKIHWFKNGTKLNASQYDKATSPGVTCNCGTLTISNVVKIHSGWYICKVYQEIPTLQEKQGAGTQLTVHEKNLTGNGTSADPEAAGPATAFDPSKLTLPAVAVLIVCISLGLWRIRRTCQKSERLVIREVSHHEAEDPENMEELERNTNSSSGSMEWCQVPVYEHYFDVQRNEPDADG